jgi:hypothetical protein
MNVSNLLSLWVVTCTNRFHPCSITVWTLDRFGTWLWAWPSTLWTCIDHIYMNIFVNTNCCLSECQVHYNLERKLQKHKIRSGLNNASSHAEFLTQQNRHSSCIQCFILKALNDYLCKCNTRQKKKKRLTLLSELELAYLQFASMLVSYPCVCQKAWLFKQSTVFKSSSQWNLVHILEQSLTSIHVFLPSRQLHWCICLTDVRHKY